MQRGLAVSLCILAGLAIGMAAGYAAVMSWTANPHDRSLEAVMTAFFATGPLGGALGAVTGLLVTRKKC